MNIRLDKYLVEKGFFPSREKACDAISQGVVKVDAIITEKPSKIVNESSKIEITDVFNRYVSRGGLKLEKALLEFRIDFTGKTVLDIGSSTGGFTDCALQHGARLCFAVDVGTNQLHPALRDRKEVIFVENKDFRFLTPEETGNIAFDFIVADVSFISLTYLFPYLRPFTHPDTRLVLLIKPQFEAGRSFLNRNGIVSDEKGYRIAIRKVTKEALAFGFHLNGLILSTLFEKNKNVEFLALFSFKDTGYLLNFPHLENEIKNVKKRLKK